MKKISEGKFEVFTTKEDAISKLFQLQGYSRALLYNEKPASFYINKKGKFSISNSDTRSSNANSTYLFGKVVEEDGKTYVTYYTRFSGFANVLDAVFLLTYIIIFIIALFYVKEILKLAYLILVLPILFYNFFINSKEKSNSVHDSEILVKALEDKVEAVNRWDK